MEQIDWKEAPTGATHYDQRTELFYQKIDGVWHMCIHTGEWVPSKSLYCGETDEASLIPRSPHWTGEGLPPVGTVCEIKGTVLEELCGHTPTWRKVEVIAHTNFGGVSVAVGRDLEQSTLGWGLPSVFRPIRTPEQIAAEEREKAIAEIDRIAYEAGQRGIKSAAALYDAGYRKQEVSE